jgi:hypothetical protein
MSGGLNKTINPGAIAMASPTLVNMERQVKRVQRRLVLQQFVDAAVFAAAAALLVATCWFLVQPILVTNSDGSLRWLVAAALGVAATGLAVAFVCCGSGSRRPFR